MTPTDDDADKDSKKGERPRERARDERGRRLPGCPALNNSNVNLIAFVSRVWA
tara:strand:- start:200 stop:358 length:159 start_codon:yes stop_codon:yes gene_type:complete